MPRVAGPVNAVNDDTGDPAWLAFARHDDMDGAVGITREAEQFRSGLVTQDRVRADPQHHAPQHCLAARFSREGRVHTTLHRLPAAGPQQATDDILPQASLQRLLTSDDAGLERQEFTAGARYRNSHPSTVTRPPNPRDPDFPPVDKLAPAPRPCG